MRSISARLAPLFMSLLAVVFLDACQQPKWLDPQASHGSSALAPAVLQAAAEREAHAPAGPKPAEGTTRDPPPSPPAWAAGLIGKPVRSFSAQADCILTPDFVQLRFLGGGGGVRIVGWGWDPAAKTPVPRVLLVDATYRIIGVGESGVRRTDVRQARPDVTSDFAGWSAVTAHTRGAVDIYGLLADGRTICRGGQLEL